MLKKILMVLVVCFMTSAQAGTWDSFKTKIGRVQDAQIVQCVRSEIVRAAGNTAATGAIIGAVIGTVVVITASGPMTVGAVIMGVAGPTIVWAAGFGFASFLTQGHIEVRTGENAFYRACGGGWRVSDKMVAAKKAADEKFEELWEELWKD